MDTAGTSHFHRLVHKPVQRRSAFSVEVFGWLILVSGTAVLLVPDRVVSLLGLPELSDQATGYVRLAGLLIGGLGMLYVAAGRLDSREFVFASMLDRPLVPPLMALLWYLGVLPGAIALLFAISDGGSFLWTLAEWRKERAS